MKVLSSFLLPIPLDGKRGRNRGALGKKASSEVALLILPLHNFFEDALMLFPLHPPIVSSNLRLPATKLGIGVFGKDNAGKSRGDDPGSTGADRGTGANNPDKDTDADAGTDDPGIAADGSGTVTDNPDTAADDSGIIADNPGTGTVADAGADNPDIIVDNPGTKTDVDVEVDNPGIAANTKAHACAASLFALSRTLFLLVSSSELVTASSPYFSPSSSSTTLRSKPVLLCSVTLVKQGIPSSQYPGTKYGDLVSLRSHQE